MRSSPAKLLNELTEESKYIESLSIIHIENERNAHTTKEASALYTEIVSNNNIIIFINDESPQWAIHFILMNES